MALSLGCNQPPLSPAPPETGPELEALQLSQGLLAPFRLAGETPEPMRLEDRLDHYRVPGVSIAVINGGELRWAKSWGVIRAGSEDAVTPDTLFQASSISKALTATLVLDRIEKGELSLKTDLAARLGKLSGSPSEWDGVTIRRLLAHTAGINQQGFAGYAHGRPIPSLEQILSGSEPAVGPAVAVTRPPGTAWQYSGGGYLLLQQLLEEETQLSFQELMRQELLDPLGMAHSTFAQPLPAELQAQAAIGHDSQGLPLTHGSRIYPELAAAGLWTTPSDLILWLTDLQKALAGKPGRILRRQTAQAMFESQAPGDWGLGIQLGGVGQAQWMGHLGGNQGFPAFALGFVSSGHGAVIMTNGEGGHGLIREIVTALAEIYEWPSFRQLEIELDPLTAPAATDELSRWVGEFDLGALPGQKLSLQQEHTEQGQPFLEAHFLDHSDRMVRTSPEHWIALNQAWEVRATGRRAADAVVTELVVSMFPGYQFLATRPTPDQDLPEHGPQD